MKERAAVKANGPMCLPASLCAEKAMPQMSAASASKRGPRSRLSIGITPVHRLIFQKFQYFFPSRTILGRIGDDLPRLHGQRAANDGDGTPPRRLGELVCLGGHHGKGDVIMAQILDHHL